MGEPPAKDSVTPGALGPVLQDGLPVGLAASRRIAELRLADLASTNKSLAQSNKAWDRVMATKGRHPL